jgi:hypothetical protein
MYNLEVLTVCILGAGIIGVYHDAWLNFVHVIVQKISKTFSSYKPETLPTEQQLPISSYPPAPDNHFVLFLCGTEV